MPTSPGKRRCRAALAPVARAVLIACTMPAWAQTEPTLTLPPVEVIGATPIPGLGLPKSQVPSNVQTAKSADLERSHAVDLTEFMNRRLGSVHLTETQNNPFQPDVNYRGFTASPLLGTPQGLSVYVDGVRANQPFGDVVSWDLIPRSAIASITLMPGSNPLFGLNTLGGALSVVTKDGATNPGSSGQFTAGSYGRAALEFESGGSLASGLHWFVTGNRFHDDGWRVASPTDVAQLFAKVGWKTADTKVALSLGVFDNDMTGNGLQDQRLLARDRASVYSLPDTTHNRATTLNLEGQQRLSDALSVSGNVYWRRIRTGTFNGDVNDDSLDQSLYQPSAAERTALTNAGYRGFPVSGETAANTPFPFWRCIANKLRNDEPGEKCTGVNNTTRTGQTNDGASVQLNADGQIAGRSNLAVVGAAIDVSRVGFKQGSELGYINPDHSVTGVGAFGDGGVTGGNIDGVPYDTRVDLTARTHTWSVYATDTLAVVPQVHLTLSGRYNHSTVKNRDGIRPGGGAGSLDGDVVYTRVNPAAGVTWEPSRELNVYAGFAQGNRAPSAIELGCADPANPCKLPNAFAGDPPLKQVIARTLEAGLRGVFANRYGWSLGVFRAQNQDDILFVSDNAAGFGYFKNFGKTRRQGIEAGLTAQATDALALGLNYTFLDATYRSTETVGGSGNSSNDAATRGLPGVEGTITINPGDRIPLIPRHLFKLYADYRFTSTFSAGADVTATGRSYARGNENNQHQPDGVYYLGSGRNPGYALLNLSADYRATPAWSFFLRVTNVFDRRYSSAAQLGATAFDANGNLQARPFPANAQGDRPLQHSTFYSPGAPRSFLLGIKYAMN